MGINDESKSSADRRTALHTAQRWLDCAYVRSTACQEYLGKRPELSLRASLLSKLHTPQISEVMGISAHQRDHYGIRVIHIQSTSRVPTQPSTQPSTLAFGETSIKCGASCDTRSPSIADIAPFYFASFKLRP